MYFSLYNHLIKQLFLSLPISRQKMRQRELKPAQVAEPELKILSFISQHIHHMNTEMLFIAGNCIYEVLPLKGFVFYFLENHE